METSIRRDERRIDGYTLGSEEDLVHLSFCLRFSIRVI